MASGAQWQSDKSLKECNEYMFTHQVACDVQFHIRYPQSEAVDIAAHKYVLLSRSPVFYAMLCGDLQQNEIEITDVNPEAFKKMLRYMYTDEIVLSGDDVCMILYAAKKYMVNNLVGCCSNYLSENINNENACTILSQSLLFGEKSLQEAAMTFIREHTMKVVKSRGFAGLSYDALLKITSDDELSIPELDLCKAVFRWSESECRRQNLSATMENKRRVLGRILEELRFHTLPPEQFTEFVRASNILTEGEIAGMFLNMFTPNRDASRKGSRTAPLEWVDLISGSGGRQHNIQSGHAFSIPMSCDADIAISGLKLGKATYNNSQKECKVKLEIFSVTSQKTVLAVEVQPDSCDEETVLVNLPKPSLIPKGNFEVRITYIFSAPSAYSHCGHGNYVNVSLFHINSNVNHRGGTIQCKSRQSALKAICVRQSAKWEIMQ